MGEDAWRTAAAGLGEFQARRLLHEAEPEIVEERKWRGVPAWAHRGTVRTGEAHPHALELTFAKGASLDDPAGSLNARLDGNARRACSGTEPHDSAADIDEDGRASGPPRGEAGRQPRRDAGGKRETEERLDALVTRAMPQVRRGARWNSPPRFHPRRQSHLLPRRLAAPRSPGKRQGQGRALDRPARDRPPGAAARVKQAAAIPGGVAPTSRAGGARAGGRLQGQATL